MKHSDLVQNPDTVFTPELVREICQAAVGHVQAQGLVLVADASHTTPKDGKVCLGGALLQYLQLPRINDHARGWEDINDLFRASSNSIHTRVWADVIVGYQKWEGRFLNPQANYVESVYVQVGREFRPT